MAGLRPLFALIRPCLASPLLAFALLGHPSAYALTGDTDGPFGLDGSFRTILAGLDHYDSTPLPGQSGGSALLSQSLLRLAAGGRPRDWASYEVHLVLSLDHTSTDPGVSAPGTGLVPGGVRYQALDLESVCLDRGHLRSTFFADRLNVRLALPSLDVTIGRQAITFGKAYFWNPLDVFRPFDPRQFDRDYKAGVDALRLDWPLGDLSGLSIVGALGRGISLTGEVQNPADSWHSSRYGSALLARAYSTVAGWDVAIQGGKVYGGHQFGGGATGEVGPIAVRLESAWLSAEPSLRLPSGLTGELVEDHLQAVIGVGHRFASSLDLEAEYFYNGAGEANGLDAALYRSNTGGALNLSRQLVGLVASYEIMPILTGQVATIASLSDSSIQFQPSLSLSVTDETVLLVGALINSGPRPTGTSALMPGLRSEFGAQPNVLYAELKFYF